MDTKNLKEETDGIYRDENNGIRYIKHGNNYIPLVVKGLPAKLEEHNGQTYLVNNFGTYTIEDGRVSTEPICNHEGILLFFNDKGELSTSSKSIIANKELLGLEQLTRHVRTSQISEVEGEISMGCQGHKKENDSLQQDDIEKE